MLELLICGVESLSEFEGGVASAVLAGSSKPAVRTAEERDVRILPGLTLRMLACHFTS